jgi:hypothetical protein
MISIQRIAYLGLRPGGAQPGGSRGVPELEGRSSSLSWTRRQARSLFERSPPSAGNADTGHTNVSVTHPHVFAVPYSEPAPDEIGKHTNGEPAIEQARSSTTQLPCVGEQFEGTSLACVELTFFVQTTHRIASPKRPRVAAMDYACRIVQGWIGIFSLFG